MFALPPSVAMHRFIIESRKAVLRSPSGFFVQPPRSVCPLASRFADKRARREHRSAPLPKCARTYRKKSPTFREKSTAFSENSPCFSAAFPTFCPHRCAYLSCPACIARMVDNEREKRS